MQNRKGFTIVEVLIFSAVGLMLMVLLVQLFVTATRRTEDSRLKVDLQQRAMLIMRELEDDIGFTGPRGVSATRSGNTYVLAFTRAGGIETWETRQRLYVMRSDRKELTWKEALPGDFSVSPSPTKPYLPSPTELLNLADTASGKSRILSSYIEEFSFRDRNGSETQFQAQPFVLDMKLRRPLSHSDRFTEFTVQRRYTLRSNI